MKVKWSSGLVSWTLKFSYESADIDLPLDDADVELYKYTGVQGS